MTRLLLMPGLSVSCSSVLLKLGEHFNHCCGHQLLLQKIICLCNLVFFTYPIAVLTALVFSPPFGHSLRILEICHANSCLCAFGHDFLFHPSGNLSFCPPSPCPSSNMSLWDFLISPFSEPVFSFLELGANVFQRILCFTLLAVVVDLSLQWTFRFFCQRSFILGILGAQYDGCWLRTWWGSWVA